MPDKEKRFGPFEQPPENQEQGREVLDFQEMQAGRRTPEAKQQPEKPKISDLGELPITELGQVSEQSEEMPVIASIEDINKSMARGVSVVPSYDRNKDPGLIVENLGELMEKQDKEGAK